MESTPDRPERPPFNPRNHLRKIRTRQGMQDYLDVKWRVAWIRADHPAARITTVEVDASTTHARFRCDIELPTGATATGHGSETAGDFGDFYEKAECLPLDTEMLTMTGWKRHDDLRIGEWVLSYDTEHDRSEWVPLERVVTYPDAPLVRLHNRWGFDVTCTPDHSWAVYTSSQLPDGTRYEYRKLRTTGEMRSGHIITACVAPSGTGAISTRDAALMGWLLTDGSFRRTGESLSGAIYQSKPERVAEIDALLAGVPHARSVGQPTTRTFPSRRTYACLPQTRWSLGVPVMHGLFAAFGIAHESQVDRAIPAMTWDARQAMLDAIMAGDGDAQGTFGKKRKPWVMRTFALLAALQGHALPRITERVIPTQNLKKTCKTDVTRLVREDAGRAAVWCPTTKHGTWYARFANGTTTITGNTKAVGRACATLGYGTDYATDLDDGEPLDGRGAAQDERTMRRDAAAPDPQECVAATVQPAPPPPVSPREPGALRAGQRVSRVRFTDPLVPAFAARIRDIAPGKGLDLPSSGPVVWSAVVNFVRDGGGAVPVSKADGTLDPREVGEALLALPDVDAGADDPASVDGAGADEWTPEAIAAVEAQERREYAAK